MNSTKKAIRSPSSSESDAVIYYWLILGYTTYETVSTTQRKDQDATTLFSLRDWAVAMLSRQLANSWLEAFIPFFPIWKTNCSKKKKEKTYLSTGDIPNEKKDAKRTWKAFALQVPTRMTVLSITRWKDKGGSIDPGMAVGGISHLWIPQWFNWENFPGKQK